MTVEAALGRLDVGAEMEERVNRLERDLSLLSGRVDKIDIRSAVAEEREKHVNAKLEDISKQVQQQSADVRKVGWAIILGILAAVINWIVGGGLSGVPH